VNDFKCLLDLLDNIRDEEKYTNCLPVFYMNLYPADIPTEGHLATDAVTCEIMALDALRNKASNALFEWDMPCEAVICCKILSFIHKNMTCSVPENYGVR
jgi:hypothetical protein